MFSLFQERWDGRAVEGHVEGQIIDVVVVEPQPDRPQRIDDVVVDRADRAWSRTSGNSARLARTVRCSTPRDSPA